MTKKRLRLCYVVSSELTVTAFLKDHIAAATLDGYDVSVVANARDNAFLRRLGLMSTFHSVAIVRPISPWKDFLALCSLLCLFRAERFHIVHSVSPKAGLLAMVAARAAGVPHCIHTFTGQVWATRRGLNRWFLRWVDCVLATMSTQLLVDSPSQRRFLIGEGVVMPDKTTVIGSGSICGVDGERFRPDSDARTITRRELGIPLTAILLIFVGRLSHDKGVLDLARAFTRLTETSSTIYLLYVGPEENGIASTIFDICSIVRERVQVVGYTETPERLMAAADIFCLPSYREGFGVAIIEAAAVGLPAVASGIYGITDAVVDKSTGLLHAPGDVGAIVRHVFCLLESPELRRAMGQRARTRALVDFSSTQLSLGLLDFYRRVLQGRSFSSDST